MSGAVHKDFKGTAYQPQEEVYFNDGREIALLHYIYTHPNLEQLRGNPQKVLDAIDEYGKTKKYLMNIGEYKSKTVVDLIAEVKPQVMVEIGAYVGYSAIAFAAAVKKAGGRRYFSLEHNPEFGAVTSSLVDLAGLGDIVTVVIGSSSDALRRLHRDSVVKHIDLLFLDHQKPFYTPDLKLCEELGIVGPGSVYAADNGTYLPLTFPARGVPSSRANLRQVVKPGNPPYLEYVRSTVEQKRQRFESASGDGPKGNPDLKYKSEFVEGWEPSGVPDALEITRCVKT